MKPYRSKSALLLASLIIVCIIIFLFRDRFTYHKFATYSSLYSRDVAKWKQLAQDYSAGELQEGRKILAGSIPCDQKTTTEKVLEIGRFLYNKFHNQAGLPSFALLNSSPLNQYKRLNSSDSVQLWCGNFAAMFAFFCSSAGIDCRIIEIMNPGDHHVVNECYLPEKNQWALTDVTNNKLLVYDSTRRNYVGLLTLRDSRPPSLVCAQSTGTSIVMRPFETTFYDKYFGRHNPINFYYRTSGTRVYGVQAKVQRYFLPIAWYEEVNDSNTGNLLFYIKQFFTLLSLGCAVSFLGNIFKTSRLRSSL